MQLFRALDIFTESDDDYFSVDLYTVKGILLGPCCLSEKALPNMRWEDILWHIRAFGAKEGINESNVIVKIIQREYGNLITEMLKHFVSDIEDGEEDPEEFSDLQPTVFKAIQTLKNYEDSRNANEFTNRERSLLEALQETCEALDIEEGDDLGVICLSFRKVEHELKRAFNSETQTENSEDKGNVCDELQNDNLFAFKFQGATWQIRYEAIKKTVKHTKGMHYISFLMKDPGKPKETQDIEEAFVKNAVVERRRLTDAAEAKEHGLDTEGLDSDVTKFDDYKKQDLEKARGILEQQVEGETDSAKQLDYKDQLNALKKYISHSFGQLGNRRPSGRKEQSRKNVSKLINTAKTNIMDVDETIGQHFKASIQPDGTCFVYRTDREIPWTFS